MHEQLSTSTLEYCELHAVLNMSAFLPWALIRTMPAVCACAAMNMPGDSLRASVLCDLARDGFHVV